MNRFAIEEDDQFEIQVKRLKIRIHIEGNLYNTVKEVILKAKQGSGVFG